MRLGDLEPREWRDPDDVLRLRQQEPGVWTAEWREHVTDPWQLLPGTSTNHVSAYYAAIRTLDWQDDDELQELQAEADDARDIDF